MGGGVLFEECVPTHRRIMRGNEGGVVYASTGMFIVP